MRLRVSACLAVPVVSVAVHSHLYPLPSNLLLSVPPLRLDRSRFGLHQVPGIQPDGRLIALSACDGPESLVRQSDALDHVQGVQDARDV